MAKAKSQSHLHRKFDKFSLKIIQQNGKGWETKVIKNETLKWNHQKFFLLAIRAVRLVKGGKVIAVARVLALSSQSQIVIDLQRWLDDILHLFSGCNRRRRFFHVQHRLCHNSCAWCCLNHIAVPKFSQWFWRIVDVMKLRFNVCYTFIKDRNDSKASTITKGSTFEGRQSLIKWNDKKILTASFYKKA